MPSQDAASTSRLIGVWFTNSAGWDRGIDHAATEDVAEKQEGRTLCGRPLGRRFVFTGDDFDRTANYSCETCRKVALRAREGSWGEPYEEAMLGAE